MDAGQLVRDHGITAEAVPTEQDPNWGSPHRAFKVTLRRPGTRDMVVPFRMGMALVGQPTAEEVLDCLAMDAAGVENNESFEEWCREYGYDLNDPAEVRKNRKLWNKVAGLANRLRRFLGDELYEPLVNKTDEGNEEYNAYRVVNDGRGAGGFLCPPGHPNHTYVLEYLASSRGVTAHGRSTIAYALTPEANASPEIQAEVRSILEAAPVRLSEMWVRMVYGYFQNSYAPESLTRNVSEAIIDQGNLLPPERHLAVVTVREYFPGHEPRLDLIADPGNGYGTAECHKCQSRVQYEPRFDALVVVSGSFREVNCPEGGAHESADLTQPE